MAGRPKQPQYGRIAVAATLLAASGWLAGPALAAPEPDLLCPDDHDATLDVTETELAATPVNTTDELLADHLLKPRVEATAREVFAEEEEGPGDDDASDDDAGDTNANPVSRSASDGDVTPFGREMYRRDI